MSPAPLLLPKESTNEKPEPDFGTYHHTSTRDSEKIREKVKVLFTKAFADLPFSRDDDELKVLDAGCGMGFLSCVCAEYYRNAMITGIDTFDDSSLKNSSLAKAKNNAKIMGFSKRIRFQKRDILRSGYSKRKFDLLVSNLVFHNLGRRRLDGYERLAQWVTAKSYVVLGDLFFDYEKDSKRLKSLFGNVHEKQVSRMGGMYRLVVLSKPKK